MLNFGAQIALGLLSSTLATGLTTAGNMLLANGLQQGMIEANQKKQQKMNNNNNKNINKK